MKKLVSVALALMLLLALASCSPSPSASTPSSTSPSASTPASETPSEEPASSWPSYLNLESTYPIIKPGEAEEIVITAAAWDPSGGFPFDELWLAKYISEDMNVKLDIVEYISQAALTERTNLLFMSDQLPDMMLNMYINTIMQVKYGMVENQLLPLEDYIDPELTPDIYRYFTEMDNVYAQLTLPDGHIYSLPNINPTIDVGTMPRLFFNLKDLEAVGKTIPRTLDELIDAMRALKAGDPKGLGADNYYPIAAGLEFNSYSYYILNALGYVIPMNTYTSFGLFPSVRNGQFELVSDNVETMTEYLRVTKLFYDEGIVPPEFISMDGETSGAYVLNGQSSVWHTPSGLPDFADWDAAYPLTSAYNSTSVWYGVNQLSTGGFCISAKTEYPELCMRFANAYFSDDALKLWYGAPDGHEQAKGYLGPQWDESGKNIIWDDTRFPEDSVGIWAYLVNHIALYPTFGCLGPDQFDYYRVELMNGEPQASPYDYDTSTGEGYYRSRVYEHLLPYRAEKHFPTIYYTDEAANERLSALSAVLDPYSREQIARFVSGDRPLDEVGAYLNELKTMGYDEYRAFYQEIWDNYVKN